MNILSQEWGMMKKNTLELKHRSKNGYFPKNVNHLVVQITLSSQSRWKITSWLLSHRNRNEILHQQWRNLQIFLVIRNGFFTTSTYSLSPSWTSDWIDRYGCPEANVSVSFVLVNIHDVIIYRGLRTQCDLNNQMVDILWKIRVFGPMF